MKHSVKIKFAFTFIALMFTTILGCWVFNNTFLQEYYIEKRENNLLLTYQMMDKAALEDTFASDDFTLELEKISGRYDIMGVVQDDNSRAMAVFGSDVNTMLRLLWDNMYDYKTNRPPVEIRKQSEDYTIAKVLDPKTRTEYLEMIGFLEKGYSFYMRTPLENIQESAKIANEFLLYVGLIGILISSVVIWLVTNRITKPILELASISEKMTHLDFDAKYVKRGKGKDEISLLGDNINALSETLEGTIRELKTANNELQKDIEKKNQIDEMRKEFLSNVSHELKTPIALIQGYAEGLKEDVNEDPESRAYYCEVIMDEASKMNQMVKKLLSLNELEFGNNVVNMERFDIVTLITNYINTMQILVKQNDASVRMDQYQPIYVWADEFKVLEVFSNYFTNAVNHCAGDNIIDIRLEVSDKTVRVHVFNTGERIPDESIPYIWDKFYKVDKARTREYGGSGVGLSIVKAMMESMNQKYGVINYENGVGFWFELEMVGKE